MRVTHVELPRLFTFSIKEYLTEADAALAAAGHRFHQCDLNPNFWRWLLALSTPHSPGDCLPPLLDTPHPDRLWPALAQVRDHLRDVAALYGVPLTLLGLSLPDAVADSAYAMCALAADNYGCGLFAGFFRHAEDRARLLEADVLSLGADGQAGVFWALQLAAWVRAAGWRGHITLARHSYENFSLVHHVAALSRNPWFFGLIDSVVVHEERLADTLVRLAEHCDGRSAGLGNLALRMADGSVAVTPPGPAAPRAAPAAYRVPAYYFADTGARPDQIVYTMPLVRGRCFYSRCTFCVQITKHLPGADGADPRDVDRALAACGDLGRHGVRMVNFQDEAMRPVDLRAFCRGAEARRIRTHWVGRMVAASRVRRDDLRQMVDGGCREVLFGLETYDPALAADMGKISGRPGAEVDGTIQAFLDEGLFLILSLIWGFPTETAEARGRTLDRVAALHGESGRVAVIFNQFALFHTSQVYRDPARFNIAAVEQPSAERDLQYCFGYRLREPRPPVTPSQRATMARLELGLDARAYRRERARRGDLLRMAYLLDYGSLGLQHRVAAGSTLLRAAFGDVNSPGKAARGDGSEGPRAPDDTRCGAKISSTGARKLGSRGSKYLGRE